VARVAARNLPEAQECGLRAVLVAELDPAIVQAIVVVVPDRHVRHGCAQTHQARHLVLLRIGLRQPDRRPGLVAGIDVVAAEDEQVRPVRQHRVPDRLGLGLVDAGTKGDAPQGAVGLRAWALLCGCSAAHKAGSGKRDEVPALHPALR